MAKDPAFLFYTSDFLTGTMFFSNEQVGIYIRLLCAQHQHGAMIEEKAFNSLVKDDELLRSKFQKCDGGYYNERLLHEMSLRNKKSTNISSAMKEVWDKRKKESQKKSIESYNNPNKKQSKKHAKLIGIENEDENENKVIHVDEKITHPLQVWIKDTLPNVSKLKTQITEAQAKELTEKYHKKLIQETLEAMENYKGVEKKYTSVYLTLLNWMKKRQEDYTLPDKWQTGRIELTNFQLTLLNEKELRWYKEQRERVKMEGGR